MLQEFKQVLNILENHYCKGFYSDTEGNHCAVGAINESIKGDLPERGMIFTDMKRLLQEACVQRYGEHSIIHVNDFGGKEAIIQCVRDVIATLEEESQGAELAPIVEESKTKTLERV